MTILYALWFLLATTTVWFVKIYNVTEVMIALGHHEQALAVVAEAMTTFEQLEAGIDLVAATRLYTELAESRPSSTTPGA